MTDMLLPVVAADDATGLIAYSVCVSIAQSMVNHTPFSFSGTVKYNGKTYTVKGGKVVE